MKRILTLVATLAATFGFAGTAHAYLHEQNAINAFSSSVQPFAVAKFNTMFGSGGWTQYPPFFFAHQSATRHASDHVTVVGSWYADTTGSPRQTWRCQYSAHVRGSDANPIINANELYHQGCWQIA